MIGLLFCLCVETFLTEFVQFPGILTAKVVVLDFEGFRQKKSDFIIKELSVCSNNYSDTILFLPLVSYNSLSSGERISHQRVSKFLHGLSWNSATFPYLILSKKFFAIKFRFPSGKFYAKRKEKQNHCKHYFRKK